MSSQSEPAVTVPVMDYEGSGYRTEFWEGQGRNYEDAAERLALQRLLPSTGRRIAEIGAGFGRLADLYLGYEQIVLFDYSRTLLSEAVERWGHDPRFVFVAGNVYQLSLAKASLDALVMVRVMHHLADVPAALAQLRRTLHGSSVAVLEYANKRNLKALGRWWLRRQDWSPLDREPVEFVKLNFDFHPQWMNEQLETAGLSIERQLAVSHFRMPWFKRLASAQTLAKMDSILFGVGGHYPVAPSVFVKTRPVTSAASVEPDPSLGEIADLFACPVCSGDRALAWEHDDLLVCQACGTRYAKREGIWDFKEPA
jgi:ubiquinone/menaquinone biosynthesis C-methylase UbiE